MSKEYEQVNLLDNEKYYNSKEVAKELNYSEHQRFIRRLKKLKENPNLKDFFIEHKKGKITNYFDITEEGYNYLKDRNSYYKYIKLNKGIYINSYQLFKESNYTAHNELIKIIKTLIKKNPSYKEHFKESTYRTSMNIKSFCYDITEEGYKILMNRFHIKGTRNQYINSYELSKELNRGHQSLIKSIELILKNNPSYKNYFIESNCITNKGDNVSCYDITEEGYKIIKNIYKETQVFKNGKLGMVRTVKYNNDVYFLGMDIIKILGYKTRHFKPPFGGYKKVKINGKCSKCMIFSKEDIYKIIANNTIKTEEEKKEIINYLELDENKFVLTSCNYQSKETEFIKALKESLKVWGLKGIKHYYVKSLNYKIDYYIPSLNVAIEYDENGHKYYNYEKQEGRQKEIEKKLNCTFIRITDKKDNNYNVAYVLKKITLIMLEQQAKEILRSRAN